MRVRIEKGQNGKPVKIFTPETAEDLAFLEGMAEEKRIDARASFGDNKPA